MDDSETPGRCFWLVIMGALPHECIIDESIMIHYLYLRYYFRLTKKYGGLKEICPGINRNLRCGSVIEDSYGLGGQTLPSYALFLFSEHATGVVPRRLSGRRSPLSSEFGPPSSPGMRPAGEAALSAALPRGPSDRDTSDHQ